MKSSLDYKCLMLMGALGAVAPDILVVYSKRWTMPQVEFSALQYGVAMVLYISLAVVVASIFPYKKYLGVNQEERCGIALFKPFIVGLLTPSVLATFVSFFHDKLILPRGAGIPGTLLDLLSLF